MQNLLSVRLPAAAAVLALFTLLSTTAFVSAHARYVSSTPAADSMVPAAPTAVRVTFAEELKTVTLTVKVPGGMVASSGPATIDLANRKVASVPIQGAGPGRYEVTWATVSAEDGEEASGTFAFDVATAAGSATGADGRTLAVEPADMQALFRATWGERAAEEWIAEHNAALARASGGLSAARDGRTLAGEPLATQALFRAVWGDRAAEEWAREHNASLPGGG